MTELRSFGGKRLDYRKLSTTGEKVYVDSVRYQRAVIPDDAVSLEITTLDFGDASKDRAVTLPHIVDRYSL